MADTRPVAARIPTERAQSLDALARLQGITVNEVLRDLILREIPPLNEIRALIAAAATDGEEA